MSSLIYFTLYENPDSVVLLKITYSTLPYILDADYTIPLPDICEIA